MTSRLRPVAVVVLGTVCVFGASFGVLELGITSPSAADRTALRVLAELERTRGVHAVLGVEGHRVLATCHSFRGRDDVQLSDGTRLVVVGVHAYRAPEASESLIEARSDRRELLGSPRSSGRLVSALAAIAGSHAFWARVLAVRLEQAKVHVQRRVIGGRPAYELRLSNHPLLELIVDRATLRPVAAVYRSRAVDASSRLVASHLAVRGC